MTTLTIPQIATAMEKCAVNAHDLIGDGDLLEKANRKARAFTLFHCAAEELAKFYMLDIAGRKLASGRIINWGRFWKRIRSHEAKMAQAGVRLEAVAGLVTPELLEQARAGAELWWNVGIVPRNASLYVELDSGKAARGPHDIDWTIGLAALRAYAEALYVASKPIGLASPEIEASFFKPSAVDAEAALIETIARMRASGITADEAEDKLTEIWRITQMGPKPRKPRE